MTTVFITGASSGMGLSHAIYLSSRGFKVIATYLPTEHFTPESLKEQFINDNSHYKYVDKDKTKVKRKKILVSTKFQNEISSYIDNIKFIPMDVTDDESVRQAVTEAGIIDVLVNNAGIGYFGPIVELDIQKVRNQFDVNFFGMLRVVQHIIPQMRTRNSGQIINVSSLAGVLFIPFQAHYSASKASILRLTEGLGMELRPFKIKVSAVLPSDINTSFNSRTVYLHKQDKLREITDISDLKQSNPVPSTSPYYNSANKSWNTIIQNLILAPSPILVSKKIEKIIKSKKPKIHYKVGMRFQTVGLTVMKRFFPENWTVRIMAMLYS